MLFVIETVFMQFKNYVLLKFYVFTFYKNVILIKKGHSV